MTTNNVRIERDSLGEVRVPADALYAAQTQRAVENFPVSGLRPYPADRYEPAVRGQCVWRVRATMDTTRFRATMGCDLWEEDT